MSKNRLIITAVIVEGRTLAGVAATYGVSKGWVSKLVARYRVEGDAAYEPRSRRPKTSPNSHLRRRLPAPHHSRCLWANRQQRLEHGRATRRPKCH